MSAATVAPQDSSPPGSGARSLRIRRTLDRPVRSWTLDAVVATIVLAALLADLPDVTSRTVAVPLLAGGVLLVLLRRVAPRTVLVGSVCLWYACGLLEPQLTLALVVLIALYTAGAAGARVLAPVAAGVVAALVGTHLLIRPVDDPVLIYGLVVAAVVAATGSGLYRGTRRDLVRQWRERAQSLEREQERERELAATAERLRIARDMHDVVGHHLTVMVTLAEAAVTVLPDPNSPDGPGPAMAMIASTGRDALAETRHMLGVLRSTDGRGRMPASIGDLLDPVRAAGLSVHCQGDELLEGLPVGMREALHRVVQEALTNAVKYAGVGADVRVVVERDGAVLLLTVIDDGAGVPMTSPTSSGSGVAGMRSRLTPWGAAVEAGPRPGSEWRVLVRVPVR